MERECPQMADPYRLAGAFLRSLPPESAHALTLFALEHSTNWGMAASPADDDPILRSTVWGYKFSNPVGLAAGFDKDGRAIDGLLALGFGFVELGSVTPSPQPGNPKPRIFRLPEDEAVINRFGFNSSGVEKVADRLLKFRRNGRRNQGIVGVNLGKNRDAVDAAADYASGAARFAPLADYLVINVSSPNTPGLRELQQADRLAAIVTQTQAAAANPQEGKQPPLLVKIASDLDDDGRRAVAEVALATRIDGIIVGNTTITRPSGLQGHHRLEAGGLSGRPLMALSTEALGAMCKLTEGRIPLIGTGGVASGADAYAKIRAGASLVQLYTALIYQGPRLVCRIKSELAAQLRADGYSSLEQAIGADTK
jgi:dihydroorotate dehydrogenase